MRATKHINAFSPDYPSQIEPFRPADFKLPVLVLYPHNLRDSIASNSNEEGKRARMLKASI